jgi:hypothetical protein
MMGLFDDIKAKGAAYRLTEEALYAEALREIEAGQRRDGLWAKAMAESDMDQGRAGAKYIKMRVQSLKDEITVFIAAMNKAESQKLIPAVARQESTTADGDFIKGFKAGLKDKKSRDGGPVIKSWKDVLKGLAFVIFFGLMVIGLLVEIGAIK